MNSEDISNLTDHVIICADDEFGFKIVDEIVLRFLFSSSFSLLDDSDKNTRESFTCSRRECVLISNSQQIIQEAQRRYNKNELYCFQADPCIDDNLNSVSVSSAFGIFPACSDYKDNVLITLSARKLNPKIRIVSANDSGIDTVEVFKRSGADSVITESFLGGNRIAAQLSRPCTTDFLDELLYERESDFQITQARVDESSAYCGKALHECFPEQGGIQVLAIFNDSMNKSLYNPVAQTVLEKDDLLLILGHFKSLASLEGVLVLHYQ